MAETRRVRLAAMADVHYRKTQPVSLQEVYAAVVDQADILMLCGDLTDYGLPEEGRIVVKELAPVRIPIVAVLGNHDYQSGQEAELRSILTDAGIHLLDGEACEIQGIGFAGAKGFAGGFGRRTLEPWGERMIKAFVQEALDETLKLESALARLRTPQRIAVLHYAPIQATVEGEPPEIYAFLGSSRLEDPINRYGVSAVFHGHAHHGSPEGATKSGIPVFNVSISLLRSAFPDKPPFRIFELEVGESAPEAR
jgi:Icc-related predicted phosphoesterase